MDLKRFSIAALSILVCAFASMAGAYAQVDLTVSDIEVTQVIQKLDDSVRLVAEKSTLVRVYVGVYGTDLPIPGVNAVLHVYQNEAEIKGSPFTSINGPIVALVDLDRAQENHTINFYLPPLSGGSIAMLAEINPGLDVPEVNVNNNTLLVEGLDFECRRVPTILYVPTDYRPTAPGPEPNPPDPYMIAPFAGDLFVRAIYPIKDLDYRIAPGPALVWDQDINRSNGAYLSRLATIRQMTKPVPDFLFGWLPGNPFSGNGQASSGSLVAFGNTDPARYTRTFAHELGHLFGLGHNVRRIVEVGYDVDDLLGLGGPKPGTLYDIMAAGRLTHEAWVDLITYDAFLNRPVLACPRGAVAASRPAGEYLFVTGVIDKEGRSALNPIYKLEGATDFTAADESGPYALIIEDEQGNQIYRLPFDVIFESDSESEPTSADFALLVPVFNSMARVVLTQNGMVLDEIDRSPNAPQAAFRPSGDVLAGTNLIAWDAFDPDGDRLTYSVQYSPDGGKSFVPLAVNVTDSQILLDTQQVEKSRNGLLRLVVTDGLNTTVVEKTGLNVY